MFIYFFEIFKNKQQLKIEEHYEECTIIALQNTKAYDSGWVGWVWHRCFPSPCKEKECLLGRKKEKRKKKKEKETEASFIRLHDMITSQHLISGGAEGGRLAGCWFSFCNSHQLLKSLFWLFTWFNSLESLLWPQQCDIIINIHMRRLLFILKKNFHAIYPSFPELVKFTSLTLLSLWVESTWKKDIFLWC